MMTTYERQLVEQIEKRYRGMSAGELAEKLIDMGVVDFSRCKILAVREYVAERMRGGEKKVDAMWQASERFVCTYEYIRKCMYYYVDVNWE